MSEREVTGDGSHCAQRFCHLTDCSVESDRLWQQTGQTACFISQSKLTKKKQHLFECAAVTGVPYLFINLH